MASGLPVTIFAALTFAASQASLMLPMGLVGSEAYALGENLGLFPSEFDWGLDVRVQALVHGTGVGGSLEFLPILWA